LHTALLVVALLLAPAAVRAEEDVTGSAERVEEDASLPAVPAGEDHTGPAEPAGEVDAAAQIRRAAAVLQGERTYLEGRLRVERRRGAPREVVFRVWDDRPRNRTLLRVVAPRNLSGTGLLRLPPNLWEHDPREGSTARVPGSAWLEPWLDSDFGRVDLLQASLPAEDYVHRLLRIEVRGEGDDAERSYVIESLPAREGVELWGRAVSWIAAEHGTPMRREFYGRDGAKRRAVRFEELREVNGRWVPHRWVATTPGVEGRGSRVDLVAVDLDAVFEAEIFTTRHLTSP
jgi:hypothetical protein